VLRAALWELQCCFEHVDQIPLSPLRLLRATPVAVEGEEDEVLHEDPQNEEIIERVAALDIGKAELVCCLRVPHEGKPGRRLQEVETYSTMTRSLLGMADHLRCLGVTRVVMEATSDYWKPVVRHEALGNRAGVKGLRRWPVAAGR